MEPSVYLPPEGESAPLAVFVVSFQLRVCLFGHTQFEAAVAIALRGGLSLYCSTEVDAFSLCCLKMRARFTTISSQTR